MSLAVGKMLGGASHVAEKANPVLESANTVKELTSSGEGGDSKNAAPPGSTPDSSIKDILQSALQKLGVTPGAGS